MSLETGFCGDVQLAKADQPYVAGTDEDLGLVFMTVHACPQQPFSVHAQEKVNGMLPRQLPGASAELMQQYLKLGTEAYKRVLALAAVLQV